MDLNIKTKESASTAQLKTNVMTNLALIENWMGERYEVHDGTAHMVSFGKSFRDDPKGSIDAMIAEEGEGTIWCVKHALPLFEDLDVKPDYCVMLDPRPLDGVSTLGYVRKDVIKIYPETTYLIASMTHPSITQYLLEEGATVVGWHSACKAIEDAEVAAAVPSGWVLGGSCSALRALVLAKMAGYRKMSVLGYDAIVAEPEVWTEGRNRQLTSLLEAASIKLDDKNKDMFTNVVFPAIEMYTHNKIDAFIPEVRDPKTGAIQKSNIKLLDRVYDGPKCTHMRVSVGNNIMWATPELAAMGQDLDKVFSRNIDVKYSIRSGGFAGSLWELLGGNDQINPSSTPFQE
jgi:hypothetical protein